MKLKYLIFSLLLVLVGCGAMQLIPGFSESSPTDKVLETITESQETLTILSGVGGLCLLAGMALLVISKGTTGWRPLIGGVLLILLNYMVARYADWIFIPVIIATGCISATWGWRVILSIKKERNNV
tara:strand:- start:2502 stop:2882 length:381 start_codon:yes stop_codon:yes gene_type:complete